jgi:hypothetical protein
MSETKQSIPEIASLAKLMYCWTTLDNHITEVNFGSFRPIKNPRIKKEKFNVSKGLRI